MRISENSRRQRLAGVLVLSLATLLPACSLGGQPATAGVAITPASAQVHVGGTQQFTASVPVAATSSPGAGASGVQPATKAAAATNSLQWAVNSIVGGNQTLGTISASGLYTAPATLGTSTALEVTASSLGTPSLSGTAAVTLENPVPVVGSAQPAAVSVGEFSLTVSGSNFVKGAEVLFGPSALPTTFVSSTELTAKGAATAAQLGTVKLLVKNPGPGSPQSVSWFSLKVETPDTVGISLAPAKAELRPGASVQFSPTLKGTSNTQVSWSVNGVPGGSPTLGTISASGLYLAPALPPTQNEVTVAATAAADSRSVASSAVTLDNPVPTLTSVTPAVLAVGNFTLDVTGSNFVNGATVVFDGGFLNTTFVSSSHLTATGTAISEQQGTVAVEVENPDPGSASSAALALALNPSTSNVDPVAAARLLEQSSWGPTPQLIAHVQQVGLQGFVNEQLSQPPSAYPAAQATDTMATVQQDFFANAMHGQDQLRQRVALALSEIFVVSANSVSSPSAFVSWMNLLENDAFGNHATLLNDVTLSPAMGNYLNMANNDGCSSCRPNENYGREMMQLFTIGLEELNPDGSEQTDTSGNPIPTYTQANVTANADALTGWSYPAAPGATAQFWDPAYYGGPILPFENHHNAASKTLVGGVTLAAGGDIQSDLSSALETIANHPNVGPFLSKQLIQKLVTSNPSPAYVARVSAIFNDDGQGVRGDLKAVVNAILMDSEARRGDDPSQVQASDGHLKEPILYVLNLLRAAGAATDGGNNLSSYASGMGQQPFYAPSVFNFYPPDNVISGTQLLGPEFKLLNTSTAIARANFVNDLVYASVGATTTIDLSQYAALAPDPAKLVDALSSVMLHGAMSSDMQSTLVTTLSNITGNSSRAQAAFYLIGSSSQYQVQH